MKLTEKFAANQLAAPRWALYQQCENALGIILDNKFKDPHISVYEHVRHSASEVFKHAESFVGSRTLGLPDVATLVEEERYVLGALQAEETGRRMNVIGDVGVGKTTFVRHLIDLHLSAGNGPEGLPIYISLADFTASALDPIVDIRKRFVTTVWAQLEKGFGLERLREVDLDVFATDDMFAMARSMLSFSGDNDRMPEIGRALREAVATSPVELTFARLNSICRKDPNAALLVVDNIDHLPEATLRALSQFLIEVQLATSPLLIVAMRDHTYNRGRSSYSDDKTVPAWHLRLKPPNIRLMLERRIQHFLPDDGASGHSVSAGAGVLRIDRSIASVCRTLLNAPLSDQDTYEFLCAYTNYNIRDLFANLQRIVGSPGLAVYERDFFLSENPKISIGIDECLIALGLDGNLMFFPEASTLFNPYSSGADEHPLDKVVAARVLQMLDNRIAPVAYKDLSAQLLRWGYKENAIDAQVRAMINKDLVWTSTGAPTNFCAESGLRLSYRGQLYARKVLRRTVFNYMMSFDVEAPSENHPTFRHHKSEFREEIEKFASFTAPFEADAIADRVLGLAEIIADAERLETRELMRANGMSDFKNAVAPKAVCSGIVNGLHKFLEKTLEQNGNGSRFRAPSTATIKHVGEVQQRLREEFRGVF